MWCKKGHRACESNPNGGSCLPCKGKKYKCEYAKSEPRGAKRARVTKEDYEDEDEGEENEEELAPPPAKKRVTKKKAQPVRVKKEPRGRNAPKPRVATRKGKAIEKDLKEEVQEFMEVDDEEEDKNEDKKEGKR